LSKSTTENFKAGYVSISGRPNVGKSTFLNAVLGQKISIVTSRPQTTRNRIMGIKNMPGAQVVFLDTPGIHKPRHGLGSHMVKEARQAIHDVDAVLYMVEPERPGSEERDILGTLRDEGKPVVLLINKLDTVSKTALLPIMQAYGELFDFKEIIPVSALKKEGLNEALEVIKDILPQGQQMFPDDMITESPERFIVSEMVREKAMAATKEEVPHAVAVEVTLWEESKKLIKIAADIYVEKPGQKGIIIGKQGKTLKEIGTRARKDIEGLLGTKVYLELFVKVVPDWRRKKSALTDLGYR
jgi:GTP-binding protein Era